MKDEFIQVIVALIALAGVGAAMFLFWWPLLVIVYRYWFG